MKNYRLMAVAGAIGLGLLIGGCGKKAPAAGGEPVQSSSAIENTEEAADSAAEQTAGQTESSGTEAVRGQEDDFAVMSLSDTSCEIVACYINDQDEIIVPEKINDKTVTRIGDSIFLGSKARKIVLPDTVEEIGSYEFQDCSNLKELELGNSLKSIGNMVFTSCTSLESVSFPEGLISIGATPFKNCTNLKEVYIPASTTEFFSGIASAKSTPNIVVVTPSGSAAEEKAKEDGIPVRNP